MQAQLLSSNTHTQTQTHTHARTHTHTHTNLTERHVLGTHKVCEHSYYQVTHTHTHTHTHTLLSSNTHTEPLESDVQGSEDQQDALSIHVIFRKRAL